MEWQLPAAGTQQLPSTTVWRARPEDHSQQRGSRDVAQRGAPYAARPCRSRRSSSAQRVQWRRLPGPQPCWHRPAEHPGVPGSCCCWCCGSLAWRSCWWCARCWLPWCTRCPGGSALSLLTGMAAACRQGSAPPCCWLCVGLQHTRTQHPCLRSAAVASHAHQDTICGCCVSC